MRKEKQNYNCPSIEANFCEFSLSFSSLGERGLVGREARAEVVGCSFAMKDGGGGGADDFSSSFLSRSSRSLSSLALASVSLISPSDKVGNCLRNSLIDGKEGLGAAFGLGGMSLCPSSSGSLIARLRVPSDAARATLSFIWFR